MIRGSLDRLHLGDLLQWLQMGGLSGRLSLIHDRKERHLDFLDGRVAYVSSVLPRERLATWFASEGLLPGPVLQRLLGQSLLRRTIFTSLVTEEGGADEEEMCASLNRLGEAIVCRLLLTRELDFVFDPAYPVQDLLNLSMNVDPHSLLMEAARRSDEVDLDPIHTREDPLPFSGDAFDRFFWSLVREGVTGDDPLDGEEISELYELVRNIMRTLGQWLASSPGLIPLPASQAAAIADRVADNKKVTLLGHPHAVWNQMVLCYAVRGKGVVEATTLAEVEKSGADLALWADMVKGENWRRPDAGRLDELSREAASLWARTAAAAAKPLKVDPDTARLAAHLLTVPGDFVLWVLATLPVAHLRLRLILLRELPRRLGAELASTADFPPQFRDLFRGGDPSPLAACLHIGRQFLPSAQLWPDPLHGDESLLEEVATARKLKRATNLAKKAFEKGK